MKRFGFFEKYLTPVDELYDRAYSKGYIDGSNEGFKKGHHIGYTKGLDHSRYISKTFQDIEGNTDGITYIRTKAFKEDK